MQQFAVISVKFSSTAQLAVAVKDIEAVQVQSDGAFHTCLAGVLPTMGTSALGFAFSEEMSLVVMTDFQW